MNRVVRSIGRTIGVLLLALSTLSSDWENPDWLLTDDDLRLEEGQTKSALSSPIGETPAWESYNEWRCFFAEDISMQFLEYTWKPETQTGSKGQSAAIIASTNDGDFEFDYEDSHFTGEDPKVILSEWKDLSEGERVVCIYAAYLETIDTPEEVFESWIVTGIKTSKGYWPKKSLSEW